MILNNYWAWKEAQERTISSMSTVQTYIKQISNGTYITVLGGKQSSGAQPTDNFRLTTVTRVGILKSTYNSVSAYVNALMAIIELSEPITVPSGNGYSIVVEMIEE